MGERGILAVSLASRVVIGRLGVTGGKTRLDAADCCMPTKPARSRLLVPTKSFADRLPRT